MAKTRIVNTRFWIDDYIVNLNPTERYLFLYFLTNPHTNICGIYELPFNYIELETKLDKDTIVKTVKRFSKDDKVFYENGWVAVKNFVKHQSKNPKVTRGIELSFKEAPESLVNKIKTKKTTKKRARSIAYDSLSHINTNINSNSNLNSNSKLVAEPSVPATFSLEKEIAILENHERRDMQILGLFLKMKKPDIRNKEQLSLAIRRHIKPAKSLEVFKDDQILKGFRKASEFGEWTIETAIKHLTK